MEMPMLAPSTFSSTKTGPWSSSAATSARDLLTSAGGGLPERAVAAIVVRVAAALAYLHAACAVHRDVKAANVLLGEGGEVWLSDMGAAP